MNQLLRENIMQHRDTSIIIKTDGTNLVYTSNREKLLCNESDENLIDNLSPNPQSRDIYRWSNGRIGAIFPTESRHILDFREYELYDGHDDDYAYPKGLRPVKEGDEESDECKEMLAVGIVAYYLNMRNKRDPKDIFADYLEYYKAVFRTLQDGAMEAWNPNYKREFSYSEHFKQEKVQIRVSSRIYDFLGQSAAAEIKKMAVNYLRFVKSQITRFNTRNLTREEEKTCFKKALLRVMEAKNEQGEFLFHKNKQWIAVFSYAIDFYLLIDDVEFSKLINGKGFLNSTNVPDTKQKNAFNRLIQELQLDQDSAVRIPFKHDIDLSIESYKRYSKPYPWPKDGLKGTGLTSYKELQDVYIKLNEEYCAIEADISISLT